MAPTEPTSQLWAVGGFCTTKPPSASQFHTTSFAPDQPWPEPRLPRFCTFRLLPLTVMLSHNPPVPQRWCGPASACAESLSPSTNTFGPVVSDCVTN